MIITIITQANFNITTDNLDVLMKIELGLRKKDDLLLARDICRMLLKKKQTSKDVEKPLLRYSNNHDILKEILTLLANQPDKLIKELLLNIVEKGHFMNKKTNEVSDVSSTALSKLLYIKLNTPSKS
ncbi:uncharacterized protein LOC120358696 [Solenopsis invicta]|uniref:uncharacterized protein LOC120358696 n=1 Tax=Solenopsis invicta TaxID=13686 RepID=UPI00193DA7B8|nr:uncharacterized protein LOC120358696 [Solenopsis invicta]